MNGNGCVPGFASKASNVRINLHDLKEEGFRAAARCEAFFTANAAQRELVMRTLDGLF